MWTKIPVFALGLILVTGSATPTTAHSLKNLEARLYDREKYFQPFDKQAPEFELQDANGRAVRLADFRQKVVVLHFVYTNCPDVCPLHAEKLAEVQEMVNGTPMKELVRFVSITTDPRNDASEIMRSYGPARGLDPVNWTFLTSGPDRLAATRELVEKFGHKFTRTGDGYQVHSVVTHVIDRAGRWRANFHGLRFQSTNLVLFINALTNDDHGADKQRKRSLWEKLRNMF